MPDENLGVTEETQQEVATPSTEPAEAGETGVDAGSPPETSEGVSQEPNEEVTGLREATKAERERRQAAETRNQILEQELSGYRQQRQQQQPKSSDPFEGMDEEELVDVKSVRRYIDGINENFNNQMTATKVNVSTMMARQKYSDFDEVIPLLPKIANQDQLKYIAASDNPADIAYNFVKASPQYIETLTKQTVQKTAKDTVDTINRHTQSVKTLSNSGAGAAKVKTDFDNMSDEEFNKVFNANVYGDETVLKNYGL